MRAPLILLATFVLSLVWGAAAVAEDETPLEVTSTSSGNSSTPSSNNNTRNGNAKKTKLQQRLENDLRARRPSEFKFIAEVVFLVEQRKLPAPLVNKIYLWARSKPNRPFQYFQQGLRREALKLGVVI